MEKTYKQWRVSRMPEGDLTPDIFQLSEAETCAPGEGQVSVRVKLMSIDPGLRLFLTPRNAAPLHRDPEDAPMVNPDEIHIGDVMGGFGIGEVIESRVDHLKPGDIVDGRFGWQEFSIQDAGKVAKRNPDFTLHELLGVLGVTGMTAYHAIFTRAELKPGETVIISAAAGAVGSIAGQMARNLGCRVIGIAGGPEKVHWLKSELKFDNAVDYKAASFEEDLRAACPDGADLYFDNVGGKVLVAASGNLRPRGRILDVGHISSYNSDRIDFDLSRFWVNVIARELRILGVNLWRHMELPAIVSDAEDLISDWLRKGALLAPIEIRQGFKNIPDALVEILAGKNKGKMMVEI